MVPFQGVNSPFLVGFIIGTPLKVLSTSNFVFGGISKSAWMSRWKLGSMVRIRGL